jgi:hypothetical protein
MNNQRSLGRRASAHRRGKIETIAGMARGNDGPVFSASGHVAAPQ